MLAEDVLVTLVQTTTPSTQELMLNGSYDLRNGRIREAGAAIEEPQEACGPHVFVSGALARGRALREVGRVGLVLVT